MHLILDNYATHKHADVQTWLKRHKRFHLHFTPTSSSWLNQVERWFRDLTDKNLRRGIFASVPDLIASIQTYIDAHNADPKPYVWTATAESILAKVQRARTVLDQRSQSKLRRTTSSSTPARCGRHPARQHDSDGLHRPRRRPASGSPRRVARATGAFSRAT